ncbi:MAG: hypothetical protein J0H68_06135 [Sphingobacteriia bacterium]|nr:hypothetical protein [Sphingobacteriia bacterium]
MHNNNLSEKQNFNMILGQLFTNKVHNSEILNAFAKNPRHAFLPDHLKAVAYVDEHLKINNSTYQMSALLFAQLLEIIKVKKSEKVLEIGASTGFNATILSELSQSIDSLYFDDTILNNAKDFLISKHKDNCHFVNSIPQNTKYDVIIVSGGITSFDSFAKHLEDNGRGIAVICNPSATNSPYLSLGEIRVFNKNGISVSSRLINRVNIFSLRLNNE